MLSLLAQWFLAEERISRGYAKEHGMGESGMLRHKGEPELGVRAEFDTAFCWTQGFSCFGKDCMGVSWYRWYETGLTHAQLKISIREAKSTSSANGKRDTSDGATVEGPGPK